MNGCWKSNAAHPVSNRFMSGSATTMRWSSKPTTSGIGRLDMGDFFDLLAGSMTDLRLLDLFSGIGGFSYAAERLVGGYETVGF